MSKHIKIAKKFVGECWQGKYSSDCILETLSKNCLHQKSIGICIGTESFVSDVHDWCASFPDFKTEIKSAGEYRDTVVCDIGVTGTHQYRYRSTNRDKNTILTQYDFLTAIENLAPTGLRYEVNVKLILAFQKDKISQILTEEEPDALPNQLGLKIATTSQRSPQLDVRLFTQKLNQSLGIHLSPREIECLSLGFCGFSAKYIGEILKISYRTIETHWINAYRKLSCTGKQQALELMYENQLLPLWLDLGKLFLMLYK